MLEKPNLNERIYPSAHPSRVLKDHVARYQFVAPYVRGKIVADVGCGEGYGSNMMHAAGATEVIGIDNDEEIIEAAKKKYHDIVFRQADATSTKFSDASIDVVTSFEVWHHLDHFEKFIPETKRILKVGGLLICSVPNRHIIYLNVFHREMLTEFYRADFDKLAILDLLGNDFEVIEWYGQRFVKPILVNPLVRMGLYCLSSIGFLRERINRVYKLANGPAVLPLVGENARTIIFIARRK